MSTTQLDESPKIVELDDVPPIIRASVVATERFLYHTTIECQRKIKESSEADQRDWVQLCEERATREPTEPALATHSASGPCVRD